MNGADGVGDIEGKATRVGTSERGQRTSFNDSACPRRPLAKRFRGSWTRKSEMFVRESCRASVSHFQPLTSACPGSGPFALAIPRKIDAIGSKFTADSPRESH